MSKQVKKYELAATVLLEAAYTTDEVACAKYGISVRTLQRWRKDLLTNDELAGFVATKKEILNAAWADELPIALKKGIQLIGECSDAIRSDPRMMKNPQVLSAVAGAMKLCAEVLMTNKVIDARIADRNRPAVELSGQVSSADTTQSQYAN